VSGADWFPTKLERGKDETTMLDALRQAAPTWERLGITPAQTGIADWSKSLVAEITVIPDSAPKKPQMARIHLEYSPRGMEGHRLECQWSFDLYILDSGPALRALFPPGADVDADHASSAAITLLEAQLARPLIEHVWTSRSGRRTSVRWHLEDPYVAVEMGGYSIRRLLGAEPDQTTRLR
jgi:hypothetical protein